LRSARFVSAVEVEEGRRLSEVIVKQLTGGDPITARFLFAEYFTYVPTFKLFLACNHKPVIRGTDHAIWRRIHLVPFTVTIPADQQDKNLLDKLKAELPGILAWAVQGSVLWQQQGLAPPRAVTEQTKEYRNEMDVLGAFLDECCMVVPQGRVVNGTLYARFKQWADTNEEWVMPQKMFALRLKERGFVSFKGHASRGWQGLELREQAGPGVQGYLHEKF
jgi:putative DNA primase/helicase